MFHTNFHLINYSNGIENRTAVRQCTLSVQKINICTVIFYYIQRRVQKNSRNKIKITNIPFHILQQQQFPEDIIKADLKFIYFLHTNSILFVGF